MPPYLTSPHFPSSSNTDLFRVHSGNKEALSSTFFTYRNHNLQVSSKGFRVSSDVPTTSELEEYKLKDIILNLVKQSVFSVPRIYGPHYHYLRSSEGDGIHNELTPSRKAANAKRIPRLVVHRMNGWVLDVLKYVLFVKSKRHVRGPSTILLFQFIIYARNPRNNE